MSTKAHTKTESHPVSLKDLKVVFNGHEGAHVDYANMLEALMTGSGDVLLRFYHQRPQAKGKATLSGDACQISLGGFDTIEITHQRSIVITKDAAESLHAVLAEMIKSL